MKASTVNRMCKALKAALNLAASHDDRITNAKAWTVGLAAMPEDDDTESNLILSDEQRRDVVSSCLCDRRRNSASTSKFTPRPARGPDRSPCSMSATCKPAKSRS